MKKLALIAILVASCNVNKPVHCFDSIDKNSIVGIWVSFDKTGNEDFYQTKIDSGRVGEFVIRFDSTSYKGSSIFLDMPECIVKGEEFGKWDVVGETIIFERSYLKNSVGIYTNGKYTFDQTQIKDGKSLYSFSSNVKKDTIFDTNGMVWVKTQ